jgi:hypothetical protein
MSVWRWLPSATFFVAIGFFIAAGTQVRAQTGTVSHCPHFTATTWTNSSHESGNTYGMIQMNTGLSCAQETSYAKKLMANFHSSASSVMPQQVNGGPAGYQCYLTPDRGGHAIGGTCHKTDSSGKITASFDWLPTT